MKHPLYPCISAYQKNKEWWKGNNNPVTWDSSALATIQSNDATTY